MKRWLKLSGIASGALAVSLLGLFAGASAKASSRLHRQYETHRVSLALPPTPDPAAIERGRHLVEARYGCVACHGQDLAGGVMLDDAAIGSLRGSNLTAGQGSRTTGYTMADWDRIVRHGVKPDGTASLMPSDDFFKMSDAELSDIVAYVRSVPAVNADVPSPALGPVGKVLVAVGKLPLSADHQPRSAHPSAPPKTANSAEFGEHLVATCLGCHRQNLAGGPIAFGPPDWPAAANLTPHPAGLGQWTFEEFDKALTEGVSKDGHRLRAPMADVVQGTKLMSVTERQAIWTYLRSVAAAATNG